MSTLVTLSEEHCPHCGTALVLTDDGGRYIVEACRACGSSCLWDTAPDGDL